MGFQRIMADQRGYYLIGYQPEAGTLTSRATSSSAGSRSRSSPRASGSAPAPVSTARRPSRRAQMPTNPCELSGTTGEVWARGRCAHGISSAQPSTTSSVWTGADRVTTSTRPSGAVPRMRATPSATIRAGWLCAVAAVDDAGHERVAVEEPQRAAVPSPGRRGSAGDHPGVESGRPPVRARSATAPTRLTATPSASRRATAPARSRRPVSRRVRPPATRVRPPDPGRSVRRRA